MVTGIHKSQFLRQQEISVPYHYSLAPLSLRLFVELLEIVQSISTIVRILQQKLFRLEDKGLFYSQIRELKDSFFLNLANSLQIAAAEYRASDSLSVSEASAKVA